MLTWVRALTVASVVFGAAIAGDAVAQTLTNGGFETFTPGGGGGNDRGLPTGALGSWSVSTGSGGYPAVINTTLANQGSSWLLNGINVTLANPTTVSGAKTITASPNGGNFVAFENDSNGCNSYIYTTVTGLTLGQSYNVSFYQAGAVYSGGAGLATSDNWKVGWGSTAANSIASQQTSAQVNVAPVSPSVATSGFSGWVSQQLTMVATGSSMVLSFMANHPIGSAQPPFALLDGVAIAPTTTVPEPLSGALLVSGVVGLIALRRRR